MLYEGESTNVNLKLEGVERKYSFQGAYEHQIELTIYPTHIEAAGHVVLFALYRGQLLLTKHKQRGLEWPGGKVEQGETALQAAIREAAEETGAIVSSIWCIGQYKVTDEHQQSFYKNIYAAHISELNPQLCTHQDTDGVSLAPITVSPAAEDGFSELMLDQVFSNVRKCLLGLEPDSLGYN